MPTCAPNVTLPWYSNPAVVRVLTVAQSAYDGIIN